MNETREQRRATEIAGEIRQLLEDDPQWAEIEDDPDRLVGLLLEEGRQHHVPRDLLWEYTAGRWSELFGADASAEDLPGSE